MEPEYIFLDDPKYSGMQNKLEKVCKERFPSGGWKLAFAVSDPKDPLYYYIWFDSTEASEPLSLKVTKEIWESLLI